jgi:hypothetical protein
MIKNPVVFAYVVGTLIGVLMLVSALCLVSKAVHSHLVSGVTAAKSLR